MTMAHPDGNRQTNGYHHILKRGALLPTLFVWLSALSGIILSILSVLKICSACSETAAFTIFGLNFGWFGIGFFVLLTVLIGLRRRSAWVDWTVLSLLFSAAGAEARFIWLQKYVIGQWCPICLGIAATVLIGCVAKSFETLGNRTFKGAGMKPYLRFFIITIVTAAIGLTGAIIGVKKESAEAAELDLFLGKTKSNTIVYFVSDWFCPACRKLEPNLEKMYPEVARSAKVTFVDFPIHKETTNFTPFNLQFLYFEKDKYIHLRKALSDLALKTKNPTPEEVQAAVAPQGVKLRQINYADTLYGMQANLTVYRGFDIKSTPSAIVTNTKTKKTKILVGDRDINLQAIKAAIAEVER